jgi:hypothetical protein
MSTIALEAWDQANLFAQLEAKQAEFHSDLRLRAPRNYELDCALSRIVGEITRRGLSRTPEYFKAVLDGQKRGSEAAARAGETS